MLKNITQFKSIIQGIESNFHFDQDCPVAVAKEALFECLKWLGKIEDQAKLKQEECHSEDLKEEQNEETNDQPSA